MENQAAQQVQGPVQPAARAARMRDVTNEDHFEAYRYINTERVGLPLPKRAPKSEAKEFPFDKHKDATGSALGDLLKRSVFGVQDLVGDKRREILHVLPLNKKNAKQIANLGQQLDGLEKKLAKKILELERDAGITLETPLHFKSFPALED